MKKLLVIPASQEPEVYTLEQKKECFCRIKKLLDEQDAVLITHYYTAADIQELTEYTNGFIGDSLAMADFGYRHAAQKVIVSGVRFMGETAKILSPEKRVFMPTLEATCSLDLGCPSTEFKMFCDQHPDRTVVVYANTSAEVKALADWVVTSSNAIEIIDHLDSQGDKIIWAPDRYLGRYIQEKTGADMLLWDSACIVHEEFKAEALIQLKKVHPDAAVLVHPESPASVVEMADVVGSTSKLLNASKTMPHEKFIVATDRGIFYKMQQASPEKIFIEAPTAGDGATCKSCARCPWMSMNQLSLIEKCLTDSSQEVFLDEEIILKAQRSLN